MARAESLTEDHAHSHLVLYTIYCPTLNDFKTTKVKVNGYN